MTAGVYATGASNEPDFVLGGTVIDDNGTIRSDPDYTSSDIFLISNDAVVVRLDYDGDGEDAEFLVRDKDGTTVFEVDESGAITADGVLVHSSDRNRKEGIVPVDPSGVLAQVVHLPISKWQYKGRSDPHVGPMAQDFYSAFKLGADDKHVASSDMSGIALAAIQGLYEVVEEQQAVIAAQNERLAALEARAR
jgi:hypothetical protein